jgi:hypothetical protein
VIADVFANHTSKNSQIAMLTLAAALYGLTWAPGTGPLLLVSLEIWVVLARARTAHHIASSDSAAAKQTKSCQRGFKLVQRNALIGLTGVYTQVTKRFWMNLARGSTGTVRMDMMGIR